jgi:glycosyltransferase involved in cell wall biosynthesis
VTNAGISEGIGEPTVTVVIPTRNGAAFLAATLDSVFAQTYPSLDIVVVDDGSTDGTAAILAPLEERGRLRVVRLPHGGVARARTCGVAHARGEMVALLDHDDLWPADKIAWQVDVLRARPDAMLVYGYMESIGLERSYRWPGPNGPSGRVEAAFRRKNWIRSPGQTLIRTQALREAGGFDDSVAGADDWDLYLKLADRAPFVYVPRLALTYRVHAGNQSKRAWTLFRHACQVHRRHAGAWPAPGSSARWLACRATLVHMLLRDLTSRRV